MPTFVRIKTRSIFKANSSAKVLQNLQIAKLFRLAPKVLKCLTSCNSTNGTNKAKCAHDVPLDFF